MKFVRLEDEKLLIQLREWELAVVIAALEEATSNPEVLFDMDNIVFSYYRELNKVD